MADKCPYCGAPLLEGKKFCIQCGRIIRSLRVSPPKGRGNKESSSREQIEYQERDRDHRYGNDTPKSNTEEETTTGERGDSQSNELDHDSISYDKEVEVKDEVKETIEAEVVSEPVHILKEIRVSRAREKVSTISGEDVISGSLCSQCDGTGMVYVEVKCDLCDGTGECRACYNLLGSCSNCNGTGMCPTCNGTGTCLSCNGTGSCSSCGGTGSCYYCGGAGCDYCSYTGICQLCQGSGRCPDCKGLGLCGGCNGSGMCPVCKGKGECIYCNGNGRCTKCGGTGILGYREETCPNCGGDGYVR